LNHEAIRIPGLKKSKLGPEIPRPQRNPNPTDLKHVVSDQVSKKSGTRNKKTDRANPARSVFVSFSAQIRLIPADFQLD
jgi:hypothetical protein